ncbi:MAG: type II secretion system protein, partial [Phycisphaerae bacterium]|nr:type II secretion system protein [Phycisphaerae bacterium]
LSRVPGPEEGVVYWGRHGSLVLLAYGEAAARQTAACLAGKAAGLTDNAEFKQARARIAPGKGAWMFCLFGDFTRVGMPQIFEMLRESGELGGTDAARARRVCDALALGDFRSYYWHVEQSDYGSRSRALLRMPGEKRGVGKLYHQKPLTDADLQLIPRDAYWGAVGNLDLAALWNDLRQPLDEIDPEIMPAIEGGLTMMRTVLGFSITDHLLPALGDTWAVFDAPAHGGIMLTGTVAVVEVRDAAGLDGIIKRIIELVTPLARQGNVQLQLKSRMYDEHKVEYVVLGGVPSPFAPAWAFVDDRCVFGLIPQTVAAALPQVDAQQRKGSILDHPDVKQVRPGLPKEVVNFSVCNSEYFTRQVYPFILHLLMAAHSLMAPYMPADIAALQSVEQRARAARLGIGVTAVTPDGVYYDSVGPDDLLSVSGVTLGIAAVGAGGLLPALQEARQQARFVKAMSQLKMIGMAVHAYSAEHKEALPESLEALVTSGHVPREALTSPFDAPGTVSYTYIAPGKRMSQLRNPSELVLAFQHEPQEFEVVLLFADGHVRRLMFWDARAYIQSAYEAAGRSDMLPDRWR